MFLRMFLVYRLHDKKLTNRFPFAKEIVSTKKYQLCLLKTVQNMTLKTEFKDCHVVKQGIPKK